MPTPDVLWFSIAITADASAVEAIEFLFNELDALGTEIQSFRTKPGESVTVIGYFSELPPSETIDRHMRLSLEAYGLTADAITAIEKKTIEQTDWLAEWKKHWRPTRVGRFLVAPEWNEVDEGDSVVIRIEPNMAFGTGTHETTRLCLKAIDSYYKPGMSFLDVGTGTGILAIAAAKMSGYTQANIVALDTDAVAIEIARQNAIRNDVDDKVKFVTGSIVAEMPAFDMVCANLTLDAIEPMLSTLLSRSRKRLVLSGILIEQEKQIVSELQSHNISRPAVEYDGEWIVVVVER
jgi:ribosomal protein L11 methyltransferase